MILVSARTMVFAILFHLCQLSASLKIAIVGAGVGAASSAYHLRQHFRSDELSLHLFDGGPIGGRINELEVDGKLFEAGASIIHKRNRYMRDFTKMLNLSECDAEGKDVLTIFNGVKPAFLGSSWSWVTTLKLLWRYGPDLWRIKSSVSKMLDDFDNIYQMQKEEKAFADLESLLNAWNPEFPGYLNSSLADLLLSKGFSERFVEEVANAAVRNNYNQRAKEIHGFVGMVSLAAFLPGLFAIRGGNSQVVRNLIKLSDVNLHANFVKTIEETSGTVKNPSYSLHLDSGEVHHGFQYVIIAAPRYSQSAVAWPSFVNVEPDLPPIDSVKYQPVTATFVVGRLNAGYFRLPDGIKNYVVLMTGRARTDPVNSVAHEDSVVCDVKKENKTAYKIFSGETEALPDSTIANMFSEHRLKTSKRWNGAYPKYSVPTRTAGLRFMIAPKVICLYPIEQLASAMEMSAIAGVNAALLVKNDYRGDHIEGVKGSGRFGSGSPRPVDEL